MDSHVKQCMPAMMSLGSRMLLAPGQVVASSLRVQMICMQVLQSAGALQGLAAAMHIAKKLAAISIKAGTFVLLTPRLLTSCRLAAQVCADTSQRTHLASYT